MKINYDKIFVWLVYWLWPGEEIQEHEPGLWILFVPIALLIIAMSGYDWYMEGKKKHENILRFP